MIDPTPHFTHDCKSCVFLGHLNGYDVYYCSVQLTGPTFIARFGDEGGAYSSGVGFVTSGQSFYSYVTGTRMAWTNVVAAVLAAYVIKHGLPVAPPVRRIELTLPHGRNVLVGRQSGIDARTAHGLNQLDAQPSELLEVHTPANCWAVTTSFVLGLFGPSIEQFGTAEFCRRYRVVGEPLIDTLNYVLKYHHLYYA